MLKVRNLGKKYEDISGTIWPVRGVDLDVPKGRFLCITGRSGSGKTTLLKMLGGILHPTEGTIEVEGVSIYDLPEKKLAAYRSDKTGFIFQDYFLEDKYTVYQNIEVAMMINRIPERNRKDRIEDALQQVGMLHKEFAFVQNLSGGEKQRISIARAIVTQPDILFADEPCGNLDAENGREIMQLLREQVQKGRSVILITHNREDAQLTDEIITLQDGKIINSEN